MAEDNAAPRIADAKVLEQLAKINDEQNELESYIQHLANKKLTPLFERRREALKQVPGFWPRAISNSGLFDEFLGPDDVTVFEHLTDLHVVYYDEDPKSFGIHLEFEKNDYLKTTVIEKRFNYHPAKGDEPEKYTSEPIKIEWFEGKDIKQFDDQSVFLMFEFTGKAPGEYKHTTDIALIIADDLFPHALRYYTEEANLSDIDAEFDLSDEEDEEDDEGDKKRENEDGEESKAKKSKTD